MDTGRFELLSQTGAGVDGVIYAARDSDTGESVACHVLSNACEVSDVRERLIRRTRLLQLADHSALIRVRHLDFDAPQPYVITDEPREQTLDDMGSGAFADRPSELLLLAERLTLGLSELHRVGLVHASLTPNRIWWDGQAPLIDALPLDNGRFPKAINSRFVDQQVQKVDTGPAGDVFCLGIVICWLAVKELPAEPLTSESVCDLPLNWTHDDRVRKVASLLRELLGDMLARDELERPGAREVADRLQAISTVLRESVWDMTMESTGTDLSAGTQIRPPEEAPVPPQIGRFRVLHLLGSGGMGAVYKAEDPLDGSVVALKTLKPVVAADPKDRRRFLKEARVLADINNPYVTRLIEANEDNGVAYIALEFVEGPSVGSHLTDKGRFSEPTAMAIAADVARALCDAHKAGIVHRDVKPDNILLSRIETPESEGDSPEKVVHYRGRLTDFGLARHMRQSESMNVTQAGTVLGTPLYMAPEQWKGSSVGPRADIYSLGVTLYYMLAGQPPFRSDEMSALMSKHLSDPVPPLQRLNDSISDGLIGIVEKAVAKDPNDRYQDAEELLDDLERVQKGEPTSIVLHPQLPPDANDGRFMSWEFQWDLDSRPDQLWPHVANTDRFNRALGLPPVSFRTEVDSATGVRRFGTAKLGLVRLAWEEHPFEWIEGRRFGVLREFSEGPFLWFISRTELSARPTGGTSLTHTIRIEPRGVMGRLAAKIQMGRQTRNGLDRLYRRIDRVAGADASLEDAFEQPNRFGVPAQKRLAARIESLIDSGAQPDVVDWLGQFLLEAPDQKVARMRPVALARTLDHAERDVIECCLRGVREGVLSLMWDVLCPVCRVASDVKETLRSVAEHEHCPACNIDFDSDLSSNVELIFKVHPEIRPVRTETYCIGGPANFPHIVAQTRLRPDERVKWNLALSPGSYRMRSPQLPYTIDFRVDDSRGVSRWEVDLGGPRPGSPPPLHPERQTIVLHNLAGQETLARIERTICRDDVLTAAQASSLALFRDLFPREVMSPGQLANVTRVTLLAVSVGRLESIYHVEGDTGTFSVVHECVQVADQAVRREGGTVVKITGDGFLAAFEDPTAAVRVASGLPLSFSESPGARGLPVKVAVHRGDAMLTTINDRLDYFGMTVNGVFEMLNAGEYGDVLLSQAVSSEPGAATVLHDSGWRCEILAGRVVGPAAEPVLRLVGG